LKVVISWEIGNIEEYQMSKTFKFNCEYMNRIISLGNFTYVS
jgi:hypothetical protein